MKDIEGALKSGMTANIEREEYGEMRWDNEGSYLLHWKLFNLFI